MASGSKITGQLFPRKRYVGDSGTKVYSTFERTKIAKLMGAGYRLHLHVRYYDRSSSGAPSVTFGFLHGCLGDEFPADALTQIPLTPGVTSPNLPYDGSSSMVNLPADGYIRVDLGMSLVDVGLMVSGSGACWVELEVWFTLEMDK
ncbi:MAG TPA: hypothetical protein PLA94_04475 [Myxococcota bacterium]|nr:hypothetical protein [Myxococcota bacterium]HND29227.1 hypothetical protein [Myxococcota bacterium]